MGKGQIWSSGDGWEMKEEGDKNFEIGKSGDLKSEVSKSQIGPQIWNSQPVLRPEGAYGE